MTIKEMHILFREFAQQMGLQNVRGLLPEQVDSLINTSISDYINQTIGSHLGLTSDKAITDNAKVGQLNALKTLYKRWLINAPLIPYKETINEETHEVIKEGNPEVIDLGAHSITVRLAPPNSVWHYVSFSVVYKRVVNDKDWYSDEYKVRLIDEERLSNTLHDALLKPTLLSPTGVFVDDQLTIYFGRDYEHGNGKLKETISVSNIVASYIQKPATVSFENSIDCDLPEFTHVDIVKHAVDLFKVSISGALYANQQQAGQNANRRKQQQENESEQ